MPARNVRSGVINIASDSLLIRGFGDFLHLHRGMGDIPKRAADHRRVDLVGRRVGVDHSGDRTGGQDQTTSGGRFMRGWLMRQRLAGFCGRSGTGFYIAVVMAIGFITFYSLPEAVPFLVRLMTMVAIQWLLGRMMLQV